MRSVLRLRTLSVHSYANTEKLHLVTKAFCVGFASFVKLVWMIFLCCHAPRSPDLTPCDFFLWYYVKNKVYVPPMPTTLYALQEHITAAVTDIDGNMLLNVWTELDYRWDVFR
ncbi:hypothetical protein AVEN_154903-1 [Araneus ventricosus]|uniref:Uncharacterized protein n=1 Tax=Araneus ventricosus TaxID=182803 RepID=A0A4Y2A820_ARAVE|nr:hypothetical protein AVEN_154903-1 [Araneus ventricosus]